MPSNNNDDSNNYSPPSQGGEGRGGGADLLNMGMSGMGMNMGGGSGNAGTSITDILMYQLIMGKKQEVTFWGMFSMMLLQNLGEIKRLTTRFMAWFQDQLLTWFTARITIIWIFFQKRFGLNLDPDALKKAEEVAEEERQKRVDENIRALLAQSDNIPPKSRQMMRIKFGDDDESDIEGEIAEMKKEAKALTPLLNEWQGKGEGEGTGDGEHGHEGEAHAIEGGEALEVEGGKTPKYAKLHLAMDTSKETNSKARTDILAFLNYLIQTNQYLKQIIDVDRDSGDKYSSLEGHDLMHPIKVKINSDISLMLSEHLRTRVEISLHDASTIKVQEVKILRKNKSVPDTDTSNVEGKGTEGRGTEGRGTEGKGTEGKGKGDSRPVSDSWTNFSKRVNFSNPDGFLCARNTTSSARESFFSDFYDWLPYRYGDHPFWNYLRSSARGDSYADSNIKLGSSGYTLYGMWRLYYSPFMSKDLFQFFFFYFLNKGDFGDMSKFLLVAAGAAPNGSRFRFEDWHFINDTDMDSLSHLKQLRDFQAWICEPHDGLKSFMSTKRDWRPLMEAFNGGIAHPGLRSVGAQFRKWITMPSTPRRLQTEKLLQVAKNAAKKEETKEESEFTTADEAYSLVFSSPTLSKTELYTRAQEFLNQIRLDYYKHIKQPKAFKEVKVFTIKVKYTEEAETKPNPVHVKWKEDREKEEKLFAKIKKKWEADRERERKIVQLQHEKERKDREKKRAEEEKKRRRLRKKYQRSNNHKNSDEDDSYDTSECEEATTKKKQRNKVRRKKNESESKSTNTKNHDTGKTSKTDRTIGTKPRKSDADGDSDSSETQSTSELKQRDAGGAGDDGDGAGNGAGNGGDKQSKLHPLQARAAEQEQASLLEKQESLREEEERAAEQELFDQDELATMQAWLGRDKTKTISDNSPKPYYQAGSSRPHTSTSYGTGYRGGYGTGYGRSHGGGYGVGYGSGYGAGYGGGYNSYGANSYHSPYGGGSTNYGGGSGYAASKTPPMPRPPPAPKEPPETITIVKKIPNLEVKQVQQTYKPLEYLYMRARGKRQLQAILKNFTSNSDIYQKMGILHKMCLMVHGKPGTGKTTAIRSIASYLQRDIYYLDLNGIIANSHLQLVFDYLMTNCGGRGVVVMEDIDCMTPIVLSREVRDIVERQEQEKKRREKEKRRRKERKRMAQYGIKYQEHTAELSRDGDDNDLSSLSSDDESSNADSGEYRVGMGAGGLEKGIAESKNSETLTLSYLLNLLDGTISIEDLVVIMTTNHPEKLDKALYRPGRMDAQLHFSNCDKEMVKTIFQTMFERDPDPSVIARIADDRHTPAEVIFHFLPKIYQIEETDEQICEPFLIGATTHAFNPFPDTDGLVEELKKEDTAKEEKKEQEADKKEQEKKQEADKKEQEEKEQEARVSAGQEHAPEERKLHSQEVDSKVEEKVGMGVKVGISDYAPATTDIETLEGSSSQSGSD